MESKAVSLAPENIRIYEVFLLVRDQVISIQLGSKYRLVPNIGVLLQVLDIFGLETDRELVNRMLPAWHFYISKSLLKSN